MLLQTFGPIEHSRDELCSPRESKITTLGDLVTVDRHVCINKDAWSAQRIADILAVRNRISLCVDLTRADLP